MSIRGLMRRSTSAPRFPSACDSMRTILTRLLIAVLLLNTAFGVTIHEMSQVAQADHGFADFW